MILTGLVDIINTNSNHERNFKKWVSFIFRPLHKDGQ